MKILVLTETFLPINLPTAKCLSKLIDYDQSDYFYVVSKGKKQFFIKQKNFENTQLDSYYVRPKKFFAILKWLFYKIGLRLYSLFKPYSLFDSKRFYRAGKKIIINNKIDVIFCVSAWFSSQKAGSLLTKKFRIPMISWYTDPFLYNAGYSKYSLANLKKIESKWLCQTRCVLMPLNYKELYDIEYNKLKNKFVACELPCFCEDIKVEEKNNSSESNIIVHMGLLFTRIKNFQWFCSFVQHLSLYTFITLEENNKFYEKNNLPKNFKRHDRVGKEQCFKFYASCGALLVVDNISGIQIPSKAFEALSTDKPIIFIYHSDNSKTLELMKKGCNVFCIKEGTNITKELLHDLNKYIKLGKAQHKAPYSNKRELSKIVCLIKKKGKING